MGKKQKLSYLHNTTIDELREVPFPDCYEKCNPVVSFNLIKCEDVCPEKFTKLWEQKHVKNKLIPILKGLMVSFKPTGTWLHFKSSTGQQCTFCIENKFPTICAKAIKEWIQDMLRVEATSLIKTSKKEK